MDDRKIVEMLHQARPEPPEDFAARIDRELVRLQSGKDAEKMRRKLPMAALVAIALAILTAFGAIAATVAGNLLKDKLSAGGAGDAAEQVKDVHAEQAEAGFGFAVEQCYWEGGTLCLSYTATVPVDGQYYLLGLEMPKLNGERLHGEGYYVDDELSGYLMLMGGEHMTTRVEIRRMTAYANQVKDAGNQLTLRASFLTPNRPIKWVNAEQYQRLMGEGAFTDMLPEDGFFYVNSEEAEPVLGLAELKPVQDQWLQQWLQTDETERLSAEALDGLGLATVQQSFEVTVDVDDARYDGPVYKGLEARELEFEGFSVAVGQFELSHLNCGMALTVTPGDGVAPEDVPVDFALYLLDGTPLISEGKGWTSFAWWNGTAFHVHCDGTGVLAIGGAESFLLTPLYYDPASDAYRPDLENAVAIHPTEAQFEDRPDAVWATARGNYYHSDRYCMGMEGAEEISRADAEAQGKQPCLVCVG